ncbi:leucine-rich repeat protein [Xylanibacter ruminicola]|uniref:leucine-rich repeat protein n=1 Tax=Xylanibacter ruminicola TaxID=839 RepID=UPI0021D1FDA2|nr:leucine-rich repeat domain-containing protein [Xylanibacter ruminicola]
MVDVQLPSSLETISDNAFSGCSSLKTIDLSSLKSIGVNAFSGTKITELRLDSVESIGAGAFQNISSLKKVWLPSKLTSVGENAFAGCNALTHVSSSIASPSSVISADVFSVSGDNTSNICTLFVPYASKANYGSDWNKKFTNIIGGDYVDDLTKDGMMYSCYTYKNEGGDTVKSALLTKSSTSSSLVSVPDTVTLIKMVSEGVEDSTYYGVTGIGKYAFLNRTNITKLELPSTLRSIGSQAFGGCTGITEIVSDIAGSDLQAIAEDAFDTNTYSVAKVFIPDNDNNAYTTLSGWEKFGSNYEIGKWLETEMADANCLRYRYHTAQKIATVIEIVYSSNNPTKLTIPSTFKLHETDEDSCTVTKIALTSDTYFDRAHVDSILIGDSIMTIADGTFKNCSNLSLLKLPSKLETIGANAFQNCEKLQMIRLPEALKSVGSKAFNGCKLTRVCTETTISINKDVFSQYSAILFVPTGTSVKGVTGWGDFARVYEGYYMGETTPNDDKTYMYLQQKSGERTAVLIASNTSDPIPNYITFDNAQYKVTIIGESVFGGKGFNLEDWRELPESIEKIEKNAFKNSGLKEFKLPSNLTTIGDGAFSANRNLRVITLSDKLKTIGDDAFNGCGSLKQIALPQTLTSIGARAFADNTNLENLVLPNGVEDINEKAFQNCKALKQLELPASLNTIGDLIFDGCSNLTTVISKVDDEVVKSSTQSVAQAILYVPESSEIESYSGWTFLHKVKGDRKLGKDQGLYYAYSSGDKKAILIDVDAEQIGAEQIGVGISIPSTVTIDENKCDVVAIERDVFADKAFIKSVNIGENVTTIGANAFKGCTNLRKLELPSTLMSIGENAFDGCDNIAEVVSHIIDNAYIKDDALSLPKATLYVPDETQILYEQAGWEYAQIYAGERVEKVWKGMRFACMTEAQEAILVDATDKNTLANDWADGEIVIPDSIPMGDDNALTYYHVVAIASKAFSGNTGVKLVELPATLTSIDPTAFEGCKNLTEVVSKIDSIEVINGIKLSLPNAILYVSDRAKYLDTEWKFAQILVGQRVKEEQDGLSYICATGDKTAVLIRGIADQLGSNITIPGTIIIKVGEGDDADDLECKVIAIAANAFQGCTSLNQIWLPATLESIGEKAFYGCNDISYICSTGGSPLPINKNVFSSYTATLYVPFGALSSYEQNDVWKTFPVRREGFFEGATTQNGLAFDCLTVGEEDKAAILTKAENETIIEIPATVQPEGTNTAYQVRTICQNAFRNSKKLEKIILPETLRTIEDNAFDQCSKLAVITSKVEKENLFAFNKNVFPDAIYNTAAVYVPNDEDGSTEAKYKETDGWKEFKNWARGEKKTGTVGSMTYEYLKGVGTATLIGTTVDKEVVTVDGTVEFEGESYKVTAISESVFKNTPNKGKMTQLKIAKNISTIGAYAFQGCSNLKTVWLPSTLTTIGEKAFDGCKAITRVSSSIENPAENEADYFPNDATLYVPKGAKEKYNVSGWNNVSYVAEGEFVDVCVDNGNTYDCLKIDGKNKAILRKYAASSNDVVIPSSVKLGEDYTIAIIGKSAFANKNTITSLVIPAGVENIDADVFSACNQLKWIESKIVTPIDISGKNVFANNTATLFIPSSNVDAYRSKGWNFLNIFVGEKKETTIDGWTYAYSTGDKKAVLTKVGNVNKNVTIKATFKIGKDEYSVTSIAEAVFKGKTNIEALTLSKNIQNIGANAFDGCNNLISITCEGSTPPSVGANAFPSYSVTVNVPNDAVTAYKNHDYWKQFGNNILGINTSVEDDPSGQYSTDENTHEAKIWDGSNEKGDAVIEEVVTINGSDYRVTAIGDEAYAGNIDLTSIVIPSSINSIGASAFAGCTNLKSITVNIVTPIALPTAAGVRGMTRAGGSSVFEGVNKETCILYVPAGSVDAYKQAAGWNEFKKIYAIGTTAINGVVVSDGRPFDVYNLQGRKVKANTTTFNGLPSGVYIVNGKKVIVK